MENEDDTYPHWVILRSKQVKIHVKQQCLAQRKKRQVLLIIASLSQEFKNLHLNLTFFFTPVVTLKVIKFCDFGDDRHQVREKALFNQI